MKNYFAGSKVNIDMKKSSLILIAGLLALLVSWLAVKRWQSAAHPHVLPQFANADRVVLGWQSNPEITVTGDKASEIVHLITTARRITDTAGRPEPIGIMLLNEVRFYQGANYLGKIDTSCGLFSTGGVDGYEAEKEKMESLIDEPVLKMVEKDQRFKALPTPPNS